MIIKNQEMLREERERKVELLDLPAGHIASVLLEELRRRNIEVDERKFLPELLLEWNKEISWGGCGYAKITSLQQRVNDLQMNRLIWTIYSYWGLPEEELWKIVERVRGW